MMVLKQLRLFFFPALVVTVISGLLITAFAAGPVDVDNLQDVGDLVQVDYQGTRFNRRTGDLRTNVILTNTSAQDIQCPLVLVISSISAPGVTLNDPDGTTPDGNPFVDLSNEVGEDGILSPGESTTARSISFSNPSRRRFTFESSCLGTIILAPPPAPILDAHETLTSSASVEITGTATGATEVEVSGPAGVFTVPTNSPFAATVPLAPNRLNQIFFTAITAEGLRSAPTATAVTQDSQPPTLAIQFPADNSIISTETTDVAGIVGDMLSGFEGLSVNVNGVAAEVDIGIGQNGTFFAPAVPLALGPNTIVAVATDVLGNTASTQITVCRVEIPEGSPKLQIVSGNAQTAQILTLLPQQIVVEVTQGDGSPFANKVVTFDVTRSNGRLSGNETEEGFLTFQTRTDSNGQARACWRLGSDAGCGNNRVSVTSKDIPGTTDFCASATPAPPSQINIGTGNNQRVEAGAQAPLPLRVWVSDACNGIGGVPVTFTVIEGGGGITNGVFSPDSVTVDTSETGHAQVLLTLGPSGGNNRVQATFPGNPGKPAEFVAFGLVRDEDQPTSISGLVLDNGNNAIGGARCTIIVNGQAEPPAFSDAQGRFLISDIPDGPAHLHVDGTVANLLNGSAIPVGTFPALEYELLIIPNAENSLPTPVLLPPLNPNNAFSFDNTQDVELTVEGIDGVKMLVTAGSMTRADGSVPSPSDPAILSLNQVHFDKVPMPMPDGAAPPFAWTLQPAGAHFDPPVQITYPNMSALPPGAIAFFLSFNHDTGKFEIIAPGTVSDDGSEIVSDPGTGITVSGWGCNCPPYSVTEDCELEHPCSATLGDAAIAAGQSKDVTCIVTNNSATETCTYNWSVTKTGGSPTVTISPASGSITLGPGASLSSPVSVTVNATTSATDEAVLKLEVTGDGSCSDTGQICVIPTGETTTFRAFVGPRAQFDSNLTPSTANFNGRSVTERDGGGGVDGCHFTGAAVTPFLTLTGGTWAVGANNLWGADNLSWADADITYYRANPVGNPSADPSCQTNLDQKMDIDCPTLGATEYTSGTLVIGITPTTVFASRNGASASRTYP